MSAILNDLAVRTSVRLWGNFFGAQAVYDATRLDESTVECLVGDRAYRIAWPAHAARDEMLVGFDGFLLPGGLARGEAEHLAYEYQHAGGPVRKGPEPVELWTARENVELDYTDFHHARLPRSDEYAIRARLDKSQRHFLALVPGSKSIVCQLRLRTLARRYVLLAAHSHSVEFITCNSY